MIIPQPLAQSLAESLNRAAGNLAGELQSNGVPPGVQTTGATLIAVAELVADALERGWPDPTSS